jgi:hypothetical protein
MSNLSPISAQSLMDLAMDFQAEKQAHPTTLSCRIQSLDPAEKKHFAFRSTTGIRGFFSKIAWAITKLFSRVFKSKKFRLKLQLQEFSERLQNFDITAGLVQEYSHSKKVDARQVYEALRALGIYLKSCENKLVMTFAEAEQKKVETALRPIDVLVEKTQVLCDGFFRTAFQCCVFFIDEKTGRVRMASEDPAGQELEEFFKKQKIAEGDQQKILVGLCNTHKNRTLIKEWLKKQFLDVPSGVTYLEHADTVGNEFLAHQTVRDAKFLEELREIVAKASLKAGKKYLNSVRDKIWPGYRLAFTYDKNTHRYGFSYTKEGKDNIPVEDIVDEITEEMALPDDKRTLPMQGVVISTLIGDDTARKELATEAIKKIIETYRNQNAEISQPPKQSFFSKRPDQSAIIKTLREQFEKLDAAYFEHIEQVTNLLTGVLRAFFTKEEADKLVAEINKEHTATQEKMMKLEKEEMHAAYCLYHLPIIKKKVLDIVGASSDFRTIPLQKANSIRLLLDEYRKAAAEMKEWAKNNPDVQKLATEVCNLCDAGSKEIGEKVPKAKAAPSTKSVTVSTGNISMNQISGSVNIVVGIDNVTHVNVSSAGKANDLFQNLLGQPGSFLKQALGSTIAAGTAGALQGFLTGGIPGMVTQGIGGAIASLAASFVPAIFSSLGAPPFLSSLISSTAYLMMTNYTQSYLKFYLGYGAQEVPAKAPNQVAQDTKAVPQPVQKAPAPAKSSRGAPTCPIVIPTPGQTVARVRQISETLDLSNMPRVEAPMVPSRGTAPFQQPLFSETSPTVPGESMLEKASQIAQSGMNLLSSGVKKVKATVNNWADEERKRAMDAVEHPGFSWDPKEYLKFRVLTGIVPEGASPFDPLSSGVRFVNAVGQAAFMPGISPTLTVQPLVPDMGKLGQKGWIQDSGMSSSATSYL